MFRCVICGEPVSGFGGICTCCGFVDDELYYTDQLDPDNEGYGDGVIEDYECEVCGSPIDIRDNRCFCCGYPIN